MALCDLRANLRVLCGKTFNHGEHKEKHHRDHKGKIWHSVTFAQTFVYFVVKPLTTESTKKNITENTKEKYDTL